MSSRVMNLAAAVSILLQDSKKSTLDDLVVRLYFSSIQDKNKVTFERTGKPFEITVGVFLSVVNFRSSIKFM